MMDTSQFFAPAIGAIAGFFGVLAGAWLTSRREQTQRKLKFIESQLSQFYSPLLGIKNTIHRNAELRETLQGIASEQWALLSTASEPIGPEDKKVLMDQKWPRFKNLIDYDDQKFETELFPLYQEMIDIFRKNYWLAEEETRTYFPTLLQYVEVWSRNLNDALPFEVWKAIDHKEASLANFYEHLETKHNDLRDFLKNGSPGKSCC